MTYLFVRSWHVMRDSARTYCGRHPGIGNTLSTDSPPMDQKGCETCARLVIREPNSLTGRSTK